jgi:Amt family ammonium transporter
MGRNSACISLGQERVINPADTAWLMTATALVLLMTLPALALFYGGLVQAKNILSVLAQCCAVAALGSVLWFAVGYSLAFSGEGALLGDGAAFFLAHVTRGAVHPGTHIPESVFVMFQMTFAVITPALIIGAYVERIRFAAVLIISALWLLVVYAPVTHWVWGGGWLARAGVMDYAGGIVVHVTAGVSALVIAWVLQPRSEFPHHVRPPHAPWMVMVGASLLWVGWFGFNGGSALSAGADAGMAILATHMSAAAATLAWMAIEWIKFGKPSLVGAVTGTIAGLATVTPASGWIGPAAAVVLGIAASIVCYGAVWLVKRVIGVDDALDVLGVHGVGGALGTLALPFVAGLGAGGGVLNHPPAEQFLVQAQGVIVTLLWSAAASYVIAKLAAMAVGLRVDHEHETLGLDFVTHGETGYHANR